jgi:hypothetical protein
MTKTTKMASCTFGQGVAICEYNMFVGFVKLFEAIGMDGSFPMRLSI